MTLYRDLQVAIETRERGWNSLWVTIVNEEHLEMEQETRLDEQTDQSQTNLPILHPS